MSWMISETLTVDTEDEGTRLDKWLAESLQELEYEVSRSQVQQWVSEGWVVGPRTKIKLSELVIPGDEYIVSVPEPAPVRLEPDDVPFDILFQDNDVVVVEKPRGVVVHPAAGHPRGTLVNGLIGRGVTLAPFGGALRPGVVHRIDKDTSGILVFAKTDVAYRSLAEQFKEHTVHRIYQAIAHGVIPHEEGTIDAPIGRDERNRQKMAVRENGKHAVTHFNVLERFTDYTYLQLKLETGRTHQIRVHLAFINHPLAGDPLYGRRNTLDIQGQALHALELAFKHPVTGEWMSFERPLPTDMVKILEQLRHQ